MAITGGLGLALIIGNDEDICTLVRAILNRPELRSVRP